MFCAPEIPTFNNPNNVKVDGTYPAISGCEYFFYSFSSIFGYLGSEYSHCILFLMIVSQYFPLKVTYQHYNNRIF